MTPQRSHCNIAHKGPNLFPLLFCFFSFLLSAITVDNDLSRKHGKNSKILQKINLLLKYSCFCSFNMHGRQKPHFCGGSMIVNITFVLKALSVAVHG